MVINVGLLVYYKINLQNSVDLAAYYAGMKQAEMLNTIGHVNYQIRQSWKLLAFRTTLLGTLGPDSHPARPASPGTESFKPYPGEVIYGNNPNNPKMPVFCITISDLYANTIDGQPDAINKTDNQCKFDDDHNLSGFKIPDVIWALPGYNQTIRDGAIALQDRFLTEFGGGGFRNYLTLASFIIMFRADSLNRRKVIAVLANDLSRSTEDFHDIETMSVADGAQKVLSKNLAEENNRGLDMKLYNSLGNPGCGGPAADPEALPPWLKEIEVAAMYAYMDSEINPNVLDGPEKARQSTQMIGQPNGLSLPQQVKNRGGAAQEAFMKWDNYLLRDGFPNLDAGRWTTAVGVEKNPWCMPYVGIKASSTPKLPFMPARFAPRLEARAFVKPFGSKIGPWYGKTWASGNNMSDTNANATTDVRLPPRIWEGHSAPTNPPPREWIKFFPNYSRFPGDPYGLLSEGARWGYGKYFWRPSRPNNAYWAKMWRGPMDEALQRNLEFYSPFFLGPSSGDILADAYRREYFLGASASAINFANDMRRSELAAIAPDLFDIAYYPIEPRFNQYILPKLEQFIKTLNTKRNNLMVRGDLGWRHPDFRGEPGIADTGANVDMHIDQFKNHDFFRRTDREIFQTISDPQQVLTSWAETSIIDYNPAMTTDKIGKCRVRLPAGEDPWTPGACVAGGRTGYSVKLISKKFLKNDIPDIGGDRISGPILNPPPDDQEF